MSKARLAAPNKAEQTRTAFGFVRVCSADGTGAGGTSPNLPGQPPNIAEQARTGTRGAAAPESPATVAANAGAVGAGNDRQLAGEVSGILHWKPARKASRARVRPANERRA
jgi:hypothetical protein